MTTVHATPEIPGIEEIAGGHAGETIFLLAPGPSLRHVDFGRLESEVTFAFNHVQLLYDQTTWRPTYFLQNHDLRRQDVRSAVEKSLEGGARCIINPRKSEGSIPLEIDGALYGIKTRGNRRPADRNEATEIAERVWNIDDPEAGFYSFASTLGLAAQLCGVLGAGEIVLLGADLYRPSPIRTRLIRRGEDPGAWQIRINQDHRFDFSRGVDRIVRSQAPVATAVNLLYYASMYKLLEWLPTRDLNHLHPEYGNNPGLDFQSRNRLYRLEYAAVQAGCARSDIALWDASMVNRLEQIPKYPGKWELYDC